MSRNNQNHQSNQLRTTIKTVRPEVTQWRADVTRLVVFAAAGGLICYDAYISHVGFSRVDLPDYAPTVFTVFVFVTQLAVGLLHALGEDFKRIRGGSDTEVLDNAWGWLLCIIYGVDIFSNVIEFNVLDHLATVIDTPVDSIGAAILTTGFAVGLAFADEVLLRVHDKIAIACQKNGIYAKRYRNRIQAHETFMAGEKSRLDQEAEAAGRREGGFEFGDGL